MGKERLMEAWQHLNAQTQNAQDDFLTRGMSENQLYQLNEDFEQLADAFASNPALLDSYAKFQRTLSPKVFRQLDAKLSPSSWWQRIKEFLHEKLLQLATPYYYYEYEYK